MAERSKAQSLLSGTISMTASYVFLFGSGYVAQIWIAYLLDPIRYGLFGILIATLNVSELLFAQGILRNVTSLIGKDPEQAGRVIRRARTVQLIAIVVASGAMVLLANPLANLLHAPELANYFYVLAALFPFHGLRAFYASILSGLRLFHRQAVYRSIGGILKLLSVPAVAFSDDLYGLLGAYFLSWLILLFAYRHEARKSPLYRSGEGIYPLRPFLKAILPILAFIGVFPILQSFDLYLLKIFAPESPEWAGFYTGASTLARVPFLLFIALSISILSSLSRAHAKKDMKKLREYQRKTDGIMLIGLTALTILPLAHLNGLLDLFFPETYVAASTALGLLLLATLFSVVYENGLLSLVAAETFKRLVLLTVPLPFVLFGLSVILIPRFGMEGAAASVLIVAFMGAIATRLSLFTLFRIGYPFSRWIRSIPTLALATALGWLLPSTGFLVLVSLGIQVLVFAGLLFVFRGLSEDELNYPRRFFASFRN